jgi:hypothetical protein
MSLVNEPDTDFSLPANSDWARGIVERWRPLCGDKAPSIPCAIAGADLHEGGNQRECLDPSRPAVVVVSRPYNGCDAGVSLDLPGKLRKLGVLPLPMDFLDLQPEPVDDRVLRIEVELFLRSSQTHTESLQSNVERYRRQFGGR